MKSDDSRPFSLDASSAATVVMRAARSRELALRSAIEMYEEAIRTLEARLAADVERLEALRAALEEKQAELAECVGKEER